jgi:hypothetical protein
MEEMLRFARPNAQARTPDAAASRLAPRCLFHPQRERVVAGPGRGKLDVEAGPVPAPFQRGGGPQQHDALHLPVQVWRAARQGPHRHPAVLRPGEDDGIEDAVARGEADVLRCERLALLVGEGALHDHGRAFPEDGPWPRAVDGLAVDVQPAADGPEHVLLRLGDGAVGSWPDVQQQASVLAHDVHEVVHDRIDRLVVLVGHVAPGVPRDRRVRLPEEGADGGELSPLDVEDAGGVREGFPAVLLVVDGDALAPLRAAVVVEGRELLQIGMEGRLGDPPVEPHELGVVVVHQLRGAGQPVVEELLIGRRELLLGAVAVDRGPVERSEAGIAHVGVELHALVEEPPVLRAVRGDAEDETLATDGLGQLADHVATGPPLERAPLREGVVVHREAVVVLGHRHHVARARGPEERGPAPGVELLGPEHGDEILVAEARLGSEGRDVMTEGGLVLLVHVPRVPLVAEARHGIDAPVDEDPELGIQVPLGHGVFLQRFPRSLERAAGHDLIGALHR